MVLLLGTRCRNCSAARPFLSGRLMTRSTKSSCRSAAFWTASRPLYAAPKISRSGRLSKRARTKLCQKTKSSTTRILAEDHRISCNASSSHCPQASLNLRKSNQVRLANQDQKSGKGRIQRECRSSFSGEQSRILPRRFSRTRFRCHSRNRRLAVNRVIFAALASSSLVASNSRPPGTFCPISSARQITSPPSLLRAE
jgi:hypothetical protein